MGIAYQGVLACQAGQTLPGAVLPSAALGV